MIRQWPRFGSVLVALSVCACTKIEFVGTWNQIRGDAYPLDLYSREVPDGIVASCPPEIRTVTYSGEVISYRSPVVVAEAFVPKLHQFEQVVADLAREYYGRPPDRLLHFGARACRSVRGNPHRLSEHALANALDLSGFEWRRLRVKPAANPEEAAPQNPQAFTVNILDHWAPQKSEPESERHQRFLHALVERIERDDLFRGMVGPGREGHANHLHLDQAPWTYRLF
jgi:hypothetical protein